MHSPHYRPNPPVSTADPLIIGLQYQQIEPSLFNSNNPRIQSFLGLEGLLLALEKNVIFGNSL